MGWEMKRDEGYEKKKLKPYGKGIARWSWGSRGMNDRKKEVTTTIKKRDESGCAGGRRIRKKNSSQKMG